MNTPYEFPVDLTPIAVYTPVLNSQMAAKYLGVCVSAMARWRMDKKGPEYIKYGTSDKSPVFYRIEALNAFIEQSTVKASNEEI